MALEAVQIVIFTIAGGVITKGVDYFINRRKESKKANKIDVETSILSSTEIREREKFCQEQLEALEEKYKEKEAENEVLRNIKKEYMVKLEEMEKKTNEFLNDITFLKIQLAGYKTV